MADTAARDAIQRGIAAWLPTMSEAELRIVDAVVTEILAKREDDVDEDDELQHRNNYCAHGCERDAMCTTCDAIAEEFGEGAIR